MEITEKEREMLERERDEIKKLSLEILELENDPENSTRIKQNVIGIQFSINRMSSYSCSKNYELNTFASFADILLYMLSWNPSEEERKGVETLLNLPPEKLSKILKRRFNPEIMKLSLNAAHPTLWGLIVTRLEQYCCYVNSIRFDFNRKGLKIILSKITLPKNLNIGNIIKQ
jgi:hypothetical protein